MFGTARALLSARYNGVVKSYSDAKGYGFITSQEITDAFGQDLFAHKDQLKGVSAGAKVNFAILLNKGKAHAFDVVPDKDSIPANPVAQQQPAPNKGGQWQKGGDQWQAPFFAGGYDGNGAGWGKDGAGWGKDGA